MVFIKHEIEPMAPYNFELSLGIYGKFRGEIVDRYSEDAYSRALVIDGVFVLSTVSSIGSIVQPRLSVRLCSQGDLSRIESQVLQVLEHMLNTRLDLKSFYAMIDSDPVLSKLKHKFFGLRPPRTASFFEALILAITEQQIALPFAIVLKGRLVKRYGAKIEHTGQVFYTFPEPATLAAADPQDLRDMKYSWRKAEYIIGLSQLVHSGELDLEALAQMSNGQIIDALTQIRGLGRWSAEYAIVRGLGRLDALPANDAALKRIISQMYFDGESVIEETVRTWLDQWGCHRGLAAFYLLNEGRLSG